MELLIRTVCSLSRVSHFYRSVIGHSTGPPWMHIPSDSEYSWLVHNLSALAPSIMICTLTSTIAQPSITTSLGAIVANLLVTQWSNVPFAKARNQEYIDFQRALQCVGWLENQLPDHLYVILQKWSWFQMHITSDTTAQDQVVSIVTHKVSSWQPRRQWTYIAYSYHIISD